MPSPSKLKPVIQDSRSRDGVFHSIVRNNHYTGYQYSCYIATWKRVKQFITLAPPYTRHEIHLSAEEMTKCRVRKDRKQLLLNKTIVRASRSS